MESPDRFYRKKVAQPLLRKRRMAGTTSQQRRLLVFTDQFARPFPGIGRPLPHFLPQIANVKRIGIALFNGFKLSDTASIAEVFESANAVAEKSKRAGSRYELCLLSVNGEK